MESALRRGDAQHVLAAYKEGTPSSNAARRDVVARRISDWSTRGYDSYARNAIQVAAYLHSQGIRESAALAREATKTMATTSSLLNSLDQFQNHEHIFGILQEASSLHRTIIQDAYLELFTGTANDHSNQGSQLQQILARLFVFHLQSLSVNQKDLLRKTISDWGHRRPTLLEIFSSTAQALDAFIAPSALADAVKQLSVDDLTRGSVLPNGNRAYHPTFRTLIRCRDFSDQTLVNEVATKMNEIAERTTEQDNIAGSRDIIGIGLQIAPIFDKSDTEHLTQFASTLRRLYSSDAVSLKVGVLQFTYRHFARIYEEEQNQIENTLTNDFISSSPSEQICQFLAFHKDSGYADGPWISFRDRLSQRLASELEITDSKKELSAIMEELVPDDFEFIIELAISILKIPDVRQVVPLSSDVLSALPKNNKGKGLATSMLEEMLNLSTNSSSDKQKVVLESILHHRGLHTRAYETKVDEHIVQLINSDGALQEVALSALETVYSRDNELLSRYVAILRQLVDWFLKQSPDMPLQTPILEWVERIVELKEEVFDTTSRRDSFIRWLLDRQRVSLPMNERLRTAGLLVSFAQLSTELLDELVPALVYQATTALDEDTRNTFAGILLDAYKTNGRHNSGTWRDLEVYRVSLAAGDDAQKKLSRRLSTQMRNIRRTAGETSST